MGVFSTYSGAIYNDFTSIPLELFPSCYEGDQQKEGCVYPFGLDYKWFMAANNLTYTNSLKMKLAIILGVAQMSLGIFMKAVNALHFKKWYDLLFEFIP